MSEQRKAPQGQRRSTDNVVECWIDVGGTFTDCFVKLPTGEIRSCKILSSGRVPVSCLHIRIHENESAARRELRLTCPELGGDEKDFWVGASLALSRFVSGESDEADDIATKQLHPVVGFEDATLVLPLPESLVAADNSPAAQASTKAGLHDLDSKSLQLELVPSIESPVLAVRRLLQIPLGEPLPPLRIRLGTTRGTNALLTRRGAKTAFAITAPFDDLMAIGDQTRSELFALDIKKEEPIVQRVIPIYERLDASGQVLTELDEKAATEALRQAREAEFESLAICLMHSYANPVHEDRLSELARQVGFEQVSVSSEVAPLIEIVTRAQTTIVDAYLSPVIRQYLASLVQQFGGDDRVDLQVMSSAGGLSDWRKYSGKDSILSGPAGGVCALQCLAQAHGASELIGLDMGGTSTDVARVTEEQELQYESHKAGVRIMTPTLPIETVASGGGSICWFDGVALRVGPQSAGAFPGPACYGREGPLTVTDLNVFLGRVPDSQFPFPIDRQALERRLAELLVEVGPATQISSPRELCEGFRKIANEQMAEAVRSVSISQGADPRGSALVGFGGAAGQHICEIATALDITTIWDAPEAGLLSALGMGLARPRVDHVIPMYKDLLKVDFHQVAKDVRQASGEIDATALPESHKMWLELRYRGTEAGLRVRVEGALEEQSNATLRSRFDAVHKKRFGYQRENHSVELVSLRNELHGQACHSLGIADPPEERKRVVPTAVDSSLEQLPSIQRSEMKPGCVLEGPATILNQGSTLNVDENWRAECWSDGVLKIHRVTEDSERLRRAKGNRASPEGDMDVVFRECFGARLSAIAVQMGHVLQQTSLSVNVKQRRDFSCAVFDSEGNLLANAPHVPVHLGAMGDTVRAVMQAFDQIYAGDVFVTNDPFQGGSHLPDITVVTPVFEAGSLVPRMFVANRAHHADVGGLSPGSMSVTADRLEKEGVVIPPMRLFAQGRTQLESFEEFLMQAPYPPRNVAENLADVLAQVASNERGVQLLQEYASKESWARLQEYSKHLLEVAEQRVRSFFATNSPQTRTFEDFLDDGSRISVRIEPTDRGGICVDFEGSAGVNPGNFNANPSIVRAAVIYVLRCLIQDDLPLNEGVLQAVDLRIPPGLLNPSSESPETLPAVAAGNVETSQRVVDVLLGAFGAAAASQGTMNNLLFGNASFGFYETIGGGAGATVRMHGASAVHSHMTNTRLTDPEILESRYPVRLIDFSIRANSGGIGKLNGGDGIVRELQFLEPVTVSLLMSRRRDFRPFGLEGGGPGMLGRNSLLRDAQEILLDGCCQWNAESGDILRIETPGGGAWGSLDT